MKHDNTGSPAFTTILAFLEVLMEGGKLKLSMIGFLILMLCLCGLVFLMDASAVRAAEEFLADKHAAGGMECIGCHEEDPPANLVPTERCFLCHGDYNQVADLTKDVEPNPHMSHMGEQTCDTCHHAHKASAANCNECHDFGFVAP